MVRLLFSLTMQVYGMEMTAATLTRPFGPPSP
jgi:hypothetical protein